MSPFVLCVQVLEPSIDEEIAHIEANAKSGMYYVGTKAKKKIDDFKQDLHSINAKAKFIRAVDLRFWQEGNNIAKKVLQEAKDIQQKAMCKIQKLVDQADALAASGTDPVKMAARLENIWKEIDAIKAKATKDIDNIAANLDQDIEAVVMKFKTLMEATKK
jgi:hypothetical protein